MRSWALARAALLSCPTAAADATILLERAAGEASDPCYAAGDRRLAHMLSEQPEDALSLPECGGSPSHDWAHREAVDWLTGAPADEIGDPRLLLREGPRRLQAWLDDPGPETVESLEDLGRRSGTDLLTGAWWKSEDPDTDQATALGELLAYRPAVPSTTKEAAATAQRLSDIAGRLADSSSRVPACRARHLAAWVLDAAGAAKADVAWLAAREGCEVSPWLQVTALERAAYYRRRAGSQHAADVMLEQATAEAEEHGLAGAAARLEVQTWERRRRPALAAAERRALLDRLRSREEWADDDRGRLLQSYAWAATRSGKQGLARASCEALEAIAERAGLPCNVPRCGGFAAGLLPTLSEQIEELARLRDRDDACSKPTPALFAELTRIERLYWAERTEEARAALTALGNKKDWPGFLDGALEAALLDDPGAGLAELQAFETTLLRSSVTETGDLDKRGWLSAGYHAAVRRVGDGPEGGDEALALIARREGVRWFGRPADVPATSAQLLGTSGARGTGLTVALGGARLRRSAPSESSTLLLDRAQAGGYRLVAGGAKPAADPLAAFSALLPELSSCDGPPLVGIGAGTTALPPLSLLPVGERRLGRCRPTAEWLPAAPATSVRWETGAAWRGVGRPQDPPPYGFAQLGDGSPVLIQAPAASAPEISGQTDIVHITAHGLRQPDGHAVLQIGPGADDVLDAATLRSLDLKPGSLVTLAACSGAGGIDADVPPDLPAAAIQAGAGAVLYTRYPVSSHDLHAALGRLYAQLPFDCRELTERWHAIRASGPTALLSVEPLLATRCLPE